MLLLHVAQRNCCAVPQALVCKVGIMGSSQSGLCAKVSQQVSCGKGNHREGYTAIWRNRTRCLSSEGRTTYFSCTSA